MKNKPPLWRGMKLRLWQLTDTESQIEGYMQLSVFMEDIIWIEVEAYMVLNITIPLLLGEDYLFNHEVQVTCSIEKGSTIQFSQTPYRIQARAVDRTKDFEKLYESAYGQTSFIKAKLHRRKKSWNKCSRLRRAQNQLLVCAKDD